MKKGVSASVKRKTADTVRLITGIAIIVLVNYIGQFVFERLDLTKEGRFSLTSATELQLSELEDIVFVRVYLAGELPANFKRLRNSTREMLDEFRAFAGENVQYEFVDPSENPDPEKRQAVYRELSEKGLQYTNIRTNEGDKRSEQIIFPGAIVSYRGKEIPVQLLKSQIGSDPEVMLNNSIQQLEYELMSAIKRATSTYEKRIAIIEGHGEISELELADITEELDQFYAVERVEIDGRLDALKLFDAILIAGPDSSFTEKDKYMIDQFIMRGGKALWLVEPVVANMDSIRRTGITLGLPRELNLEDQLFKYGVRVNRDFILDLQALPIPIVTGMIGNQPKQEFFPWYYFPLLMNKSNHPIVNNIDAVMTNFISSIDTVGSPGIKKTPLLVSSQYSKIANAPHRISLNILREAPDERQYNKGNLMGAILLEGEFESVFKNRLSPAVTENPEFRYIEKSEPTAMIVVSDADIIRNRANPETKEFYALGFDRYTKRTYGNKEFISNCMSYLLDDDGLILARSKEFTIRLLDKQRVEKERGRWQIFNTSTPIVLVLIFGFIHAYLRRRKFAKR